MPLRRTMLAVLLVAAGFASASAAALPRVVQITIDGAAFADPPKGVAINVGDTIEWFNKDVVNHTATAKNGDWDVVVPKGRKVLTVLKRPGTVDYYCRYHPNMTGRIVIGTSK